MRALPFSQSDDEPAVTLGPDDLEAALRLLADEAVDVQSLRRAFLTEAAQNLGVGLMLFAGPLGLITIWFNRAWGIGLLVVAFVALIVLAFGPTSKVEEWQQRFKDRLEGTELLPTSLAGRMQSVASTIIYLASPAIVVGGVGWLLWGIVRHGEVKLIPLLLAIGPTIAFWTWLAIDNILELRYLSRVANMHARLEKHAQVAATTAEDDAAIAVSSTELGVLSRAETQQVKRTVGEAVETLPEVLDSSYGITVARPVLDGLARLAEKNPATWLQVQEAIFALQHNPRPPGSHESSEIPGATELVVESSGVEYVVDESEHRVHVIACSIEEQTIDAS